MKHNNKNLESRGNKQCPGDECAGTLKVDFI